MSQQGPLNRATHPGTITFVTKYDGKTDVKPISEFPDSFIFVNGRPVVREEFYSYDEQGLPCPPAEADTGKILRYGPEGELLQSVAKGPRRKRH